MVEIEDARDLADDFGEAAYLLCFDLQIVVFVGHELVFLEIRLDLRLLLNFRLDLVDSGKVDFLFELLDFSESVLD